MEYQTPYQKKKQQKITDHVNRRSQQESIREDMINKAIQVKLESHTIEGKASRLCRLGIHKYRKHSSFFINPSIRTEIDIPCIDKEDVYICVRPNCIACKIEYNDTMHVRDARQCGYKGGDYRDRTA